jgi:hypothetical protein
LLTGDRLEMNGRESRGAFIVVGLCSYRRRRGKIRGEDLIEVVSHGHEMSCCDLIFY